MVFVSLANQNVNTLLLFDLYFYCILDWADIYGVQWTTLLFSSFQGISR